MKTATPQTSTKTYTVAGTVRRPYGKWAVLLNTNVTQGDDTWRAAESESAAVFDTDADAYAAGERAVAHITATGSYPNMCEKF